MKSFTQRIGDRRLAEPRRAIQPIDIGRIGTSFQIPLECGLGRPNNERIEECCARSFHTLALLVIIRRIDGFQSFKDVRVFYDINPVN
jgi:hypothetical protein